MTKKHLALYGLKWNPFAPDVPVEALHVTPRIQSFCWRVEQLASEGVEPEKPPYRPGGRTEGHRICFVRDPDGYRIEIVGP